MDNTIRSSCFRFNTITLAGLIILMYFAIPAMAKVKVHKPLISIQPGTTNTSITVKGSTGAIKSTCQVMVIVSNLTTKELTDIILQQDGSFTIEIEATGGNEIRIIAKNVEGKRSYGTFTVPVFQNIAKVKVKPKDKNIQDKDNINTQKDSTKSTELSGQGNINIETRTNIAVIITMVNTDTNQIISTQRIITCVKPNTDKQRTFTSIANDILAGCKKILTPKPIAAVPEKKSPPKIIASKKQQNTSHKVPTPATVNRHKK